eukprot:TRINITY_DN13106_c0_g1_i1.p1 TRINITY_DN13106_c0_g1~~TRINITY_DN13106_c0_g1_i1.p1  ORF type:complete len:302 (+),score=38.10 TRINITY_DN13106_c0_g1_i1:123-908(+)
MDIILFLITHNAHNLTHNLTHNTQRRNNNNTTTHYNTFISIFVFFCFRRLDIHPPIHWQVQNQMELQLSSPLKSPRNTATRTLAAGPRSPQVRRLSFTGAKKPGSLIPPLHLNMRTPEGYTVERELGVCALGMTRCGWRDADRTPVLIKSIDKSQCTPENQGLARVRKEVTILRDQIISHPHIAQLIDCIETDRDVHVITEYVRGGDLYDFIYEDDTTLPILWGLVAPPTPSSPRALSVLSPRLGSSHISNGPFKYCVFQG